MTAHLLLIRHGQTEWNRDRRIQGNGDSPLTELGQAQAEAAARALERFDIAAIYASDAGRALQTAAPIAEATGCTPQTDLRLRERHYGLFEGKTHEDLRRQHADLHDEYLKRDPHFVVPGGESLAQVQARMVTACTEIARRHDGQHVVVIAHGGTVRAFSRFVLGVPLDVVWRAHIDNCSLTIVCHDKTADQPWAMRTMNEIAHLPSMERGFG
jgi:probable phosphoglycerate mutase